MIDGEGNARLANIGIAGIITEPLSLSSVTTCGSTDIRYMAPELLEPATATLMRSDPPRESDVYSLAMTAYEVLSDEPPFGSFRGSVIVYRIVLGERPLRPNNQTTKRWLSDSIWEAIQCCWDVNAQSRLPIDSLRRVLIESKQEKGDVPQAGPAIRGDPAIAHIDSPERPSLEPTYSHQQGQSASPPVEKDSPHDARPLTDSPTEGSEPPVQPKPNPFRKALARIRRLIRRVSRRG